MSTHSMFPIKVGHETVMAINAFGRLYIPLRSLVTGTIGATWSASRTDAVERMGTRWRIKTLPVSAASGRVSVQPCLHAARLTAFLWTLRPGKQETRARLAQLQDNWEDALMRHLDVASPEIGDAPAGAVSVLIENARKPLLRELEEARRTPATPEMTLRDAALRRWETQKGKVLSTDDFLAMAEMDQEGITPTEIAKAAGCSRSAVSRFLHGSLTTKSAIEAMRILKSGGWTPKSALGHKK